MDSTIERKPETAKQEKSERPGVHEKVGVMPAGEGLTRRKFTFAVGAFLAGLAGCAPRRGIQIARNLSALAGGTTVVPAGKTIAGYVVEDVDYARIFAGSQVLVLGDVSHTLPENVEELAASVKQLKKAGVTHIALEALKAIHQKEVDAFLAGRLSDSEIAPVIKADWHFPRVQEPYLKLLKACRKEGVKVVALDIPDRNVNRVEGYSGMETAVARNYVWANRLMPILEEKSLDGKKPRIVVFGGTFHTAEKKEANSVTQLLRGEGVKVENAVIEIGDPREMDGPSRELYSKIIKAGVFERHFMLHKMPWNDHNNLIYVPSRFQDHLEIQLRKDEKTLRDEKSSPLSLQNDLTVIRNPEEIPGFLERMSRLVKDTSIPTENRLAIVHGITTTAMESELWHQTMKYVAEHDPDSKVRQSAKRRLD